MFKIWIIYYGLQLLFRRKIRDRKSLLSWQKEKLHQFQRKVLLNSPYYKALLDKGFDIDSFPIIGKKEFVEHFDQINTLGLKAEEAFAFAIKAEQEKDFQTELKGCTVGLSTGTSGNRSLFLASPKERALWAANIFSRVVRPRLFKRQKVAFILRANSNLYESVSSIFFQFKFYDLSSPPEEIIKSLNLYQPDILSAQPSLMTILAKAKREKDLHIQPTQLISYAEVLDSLDKKNIETAFGRIVTEVYQCTEGFLGHTCKYGSMHLNEDLVRIEKHYIAPHRFQPIVTDFSRSSQPVVRYLMNDILVESQEACPCGSPMIQLDKIEGRMDEVLIFRNEEDKEVRIFPDFIRRCIVMADDRIENYQLIQDDENSVQVYVDCLDENYYEVIERLQIGLLKLFASYQVQNIAMHFLAGIPPKNAADKMRRIVRRVK